MNCVGISEIIVARLSEEFANDPGFRIFYVDSEQEMQEAYDLVSELEESPIYLSEEQEFIADLRWVIALLVVVMGVMMIFFSETLFHQSSISSK